MSSYDKNLRQHQSDLLQKTIENINYLIERRNLLKYHIELNKDKKETGNHPTDDEFTMGFIIRFQHEELKIINEALK